MNQINEINKNLVIQVMAKITCDFCHAWEGTVYKHGMDTDTAKDRYGDGWRVYGGKVYCPHCSSNKSCIVDKYNELLLAVEEKHPNETRHETALRYIKEAEATSKPLKELDSYGKRTEAI